MKKIICVILCIVLLGGCSCVETGELKMQSMFIKVEQSYFWKVVYHRDTKVMYAVSYGRSNYGNFTLLVNADGTPMLYKGGD